MVKSHNRAENYIIGYYSGQYQRVSVSVYQLLADTLNAERLFRCNIGGVQNFKTLIHGVKLIQSRLIISDRRGKDNLINFAISRRSDE